MWHGCGIRDGCQLTAPEALDRRCGHVGTADLLEHAADYSRHDRNGHPSPLNKLSTRQAHLAVQASASGPHSTPHAVALVRPDIKHGHAGDAAPESRPARRTRYTSLAGHTDARIGYQKADERLLAVAEATANITGGFPVSQDPESSAQNRLIVRHEVARVE